jgi:hypothetical protein
MSRRFLCPRGGLASYAVRPRRKVLHITTSSAGSWLPPQLDKIREKLVDKTYRTNVPLELFAYSMHDEVDGHVDGLAAIENCINTYLPGSKFRRVSVFNRGFLQLVYRS